MCTAVSSHNGCSALAAGLARDTRCSKCDVYDTVSSISWLPLAGVIPAESIGLYRYFSLLSSGQKYAPVRFFQKSWDHKNYINGYMGSLMKRNGVYIYIYSFVKGMRIYQRLYSLQNKRFLCLNWHRFVATSTPDNT